MRWSPGFGMRGSAGPKILIVDDDQQTRALLRKEPFLSSVGVIVVTGYAHSPQVAQIREIEFQEILPKPFRKAELLEKVARG